MRTVSDILEAATKIDISYMVELSLIESREEYLRLQKEQMAQGKRSDGRPIYNVKTGSVTYSPKYAKYKGKLLPIDLHDTGAFYDEMFLMVEGSDKAIVDSLDSKSAKLTENYGEKIWTLNDDSKVQFVPVAQNNLVTLVEKELDK